MKDEQDFLDDDRVAIVWIAGEECIGVVRSYGAYVSLVEFEKDGFLHRVWLDNDDYTVIDFLLFKHEREE